MKRMWLCALFTIAGCLGTDVGNPSGGDGAPGDGPGPTTDGSGAIFFDIDVVLYPKAPTLPSGLQIERAWVSLDRIRLRPAAGCEDDVEPDLSDQLPVDMLAPGAPEPLRDVDAAPGGYCRIDVEWAKLKVLTDPQAPPGLLDHSFFIDGTRADGTRFELCSDQGDEIRLGAVDQNGFPIDAATKALFVTLDADRLFAGIDVDAAEVGSDGIIHIDDENNVALIEQFEENLDGATRLFDDDDDDGELEGPEHDPEDVLAE